MGRLKDLHAAACAVVAILFLIFVLGLLMHSDIHHRHALEEIHFALMFPLRDLYTLGFALIHVSYSMAKMSQLPCSALKCRA